jgi:hypothetical protein
MYLRDHPNTMRMARECLTSDPATGLLAPKLNPSYIVEAGCDGILGRPIIQT